MVWPIPLLESIGITNTFIRK